MKQEEMPLIACLNGEAKRGEPDECAYYDYTLGRKRCQKGKCRWCDFHYWNKNSNKKMKLVRIKLGKKCPNCHQFGLQYWHYPITAEVFLRCCFCFSEYKEVEK